MALLRTFEVVFLRSQKIFQFLGRKKITFNLHFFFSFFFAFSSYLETQTSVTDSTHGHKSYLGEGGVRGVGVRDSKL